MIVVLHNSNRLVKRPMIIFVCARERVCARARMFSGLSKIDLAHMSCETCRPTLCTIVIFREQHLVQTCFQIHARTEQYIDIVIQHNSCLFLVLKLITVK